MMPYRRIVNSPLKPDQWRNRKTSVAQRDQYISLRAVGYTASRIAEMFEVPVNRLYTAWNWERRNEAARLRQAKLRQEGKVDLKKKNEDRMRLRQRKKEQPDIVELMSDEQYDKLTKVHTRAVRQWYNKHKTSQGKE